MTQIDLEALLQQLVALGEDAEELEYWRTIFDALTPEHQTELEQNLKNEIQALKETQTPVVSASQTTLPPPPSLTNPALPPLTPSTEPVSPSTPQNPFTI